MISFLYYELARAKARDLERRTDRLAPVTEMRRAVKAECDHDVVFPTTRVEGPQAGKARPGIAAIQGLRPGPRLPALASEITVQRCLCQGNRSTDDCCA
jgi:hypothetical protein